MFLEPRIESLIGHASAPDPSSAFPPDSRELPRLPAPLPSSDSFYLPLETGNFASDDAFQNTYQHGPNCAIPVSQQQYSGVADGRLQSSQRVTREIDTDRETPRFFTRPGVPLEKVLNGSHESESHHRPRNTVEEVPEKPQRIDERQGNQLLHLPRPPVKKGIKRQRIPPLLQGLHHPPPDAGIFPRITANGLGEANADAQQAKATLQTHDIPASRSDTGGQNIPSAAPKTHEKATRQRNKWTEQETADLLKGVARFGVGSWKKISKCEDYHFNDRTTVDLKDRFRTCCPDAYRSSKEKKPDTPKVTNRPARDHGLEKVDSNGRKEDLTLSKSSKFCWTGSRSQRKGREELAKLGIRELFPDQNRRARRKFSDEEDLALLAGFEKHGAEWTVILNDPVFQISKRRRTDLRDRFRNRWPHKYASAGLAGRPPDFHTRNRRPATNAEDEERSKQEEANKAAPNREESRDCEQTEHNPSGEATKDPEVQPPKNTTSLFPDLVDYLEDFGDAPNSPITLDRSIFDWANQNVAPSAPTSHARGDASSSVPLLITTSNGAMENTPASVDPLHVNPLVTLNRPCGPAGSFNLPSLASIGSRPHEAGQLASTTGPGRYSAANMVIGINLPSPANLLAGSAEPDLSRDGHTGGALDWDDLLN